ncbi:pentapeptide repeat-containing protein [Streptomyces sp. NPDC006552]|uniref:pentapeptide repeat-containing protein n=1 Tax=Streptomyces sp. NPDC006552 TaxID=3157179 RepID=UPI0033B520CC
MTSASPSLTPPEWPHCGDGSAPDDPVGCRGIHVPGHGQCLAHLADPDRDAYLAGLTPGADIDHRGTTFTQALLDALLASLRSSPIRRPHLGNARFDEATFTGTSGFGAATFAGDAWFSSATFAGDARFDGVTFTGDARFNAVTFTGLARFSLARFTGIALFGSATFKGDARFDEASFTGTIALFGSATFTRTARFDEATFTGDAWFHSAMFPREARFDYATFTGDAWFSSATFTRTARFEWATFTGDALFSSATFTGTAYFISTTFPREARFDEATFTRDARFDAATFAGDAWFESATFERAATLGPLVCAGRVRLSGTVFGGPVTLLLAARRVECRRTRWSATAELRLRYATLDFSHAVFEYPLTIAAEAAPYLRTNGQPVTEELFAGTPDASVRVSSLRGVDAAHLVLAGVDLSRCLFIGTVHLSQLSLEGACSFGVAPAPLGPGRGPRFSARRTLAEEHHWRAGRPHAASGWNPAVLGAGDVGPPQLAPVYRALRKALEDGKDEPGAADFYYGEMEMRRHDRVGTTWPERGLLKGYWLLSGYGLRASRALGWLAAGMLVTIAAMALWGLPSEDPKPQTTGRQVSSGQDLKLTTDTPDPVNPTGSLVSRVSTERLEKGLRVVINSVVFRSSGQDLTTAGTYTEMLSRITEPVLLGFVVLAIRNRVKR